MTADSVFAVPRSASPPDATLGSGTNLRRLKSRLHPSLVSLGPVIRSYPQGI